VRIAKASAALRTCTFVAFFMHGSVLAGKLVRKMADIPDSVFDDKYKAAQLCPPKQATIRVKERALAIPKTGREVSWIE